MRYYIITFGCQMNVHDSEIMAGLLEGMGYTQAKSMEDADIVLINTCTVRSKPVEKTFSYLGQLQKLKRRNPKMIIGVCGCMAQRDAELIKQRAPFVDLLLGPRNLHHLPELIEQAIVDSHIVELRDLTEQPQPPSLIKRRSDISAYVTIIHGCNRQCTFCVVPTARGAQWSVPPDVVLKQVEELIESGYKEIILLGQNVDAYGHDIKNREITLAWLLERIDEMIAQKRVRVRFTTNYPLYVTDELINAIAELESVCESIHMPVQSGDNYILRLMRRGYSVEQYLRVVEKLRERVQKIAIATDVMVGFPGEREEHFQNTIKLMERVEFDQAFMFAYSPRPNTAAASMPEQVPMDVRLRRLRELIALQNEIQQRKNERELGEVVEVLIEGESEKDRTKLSGRTRTNKVVVLDGDASLQGKFVNVRLTKAYLWGFEGELVKDDCSPSPLRK
ncbi:MAG: tRNA (N6-isopentenyl adenosine(37)-C2)-methylthiotransferase MiaB, partial [Armatimonadota bacterium]|nr:tRNA (N6-isopentenyl adenosine(37)-C2)-methylthiotransferase MiaB [Armatimonadota bacterium]MDW8026362.1 tRNA (N6-isopentenyl adenosine(37)-C2)-methylthiotransferase MiaB [Armatimonadota bacterium]